jgi:hypothetical protein
MDAEIELIGLEVVVAAVTANAGANIQMSAA